MLQWTPDNEVVSREIIHLGKSLIGENKASEDRRSITHLTSGQNSDGLHRDLNKDRSQILVNNKQALNKNREKRRVVEERTKMTVKSLVESVLLAKVIK